jgi:hypothetical protein
MFDENLTLIVSNKRYADMFNLPQDFVRPGVSIREIIERSFAIGNYRHTALTADGVYDSYVESLSAGDLIFHRHLADGRIIKLTHERMAKGGWVAIYEDITERHRAEESINDTLGHPIGDRLLGIIAERVRGVVREGDTIARLGGDEFAVLQSGSSANAAGALARRLVATISEPIEIDGQEINSSVSIGIALAPNDGTAADHLMKRSTAPRQRGAARSVSSSPTWTRASSAAARSR